jgi:DNA-binding NtrC family response regulator
MTEKKGKILCVDDEPNIVRALQWLLQKDFEVVTANSGQDALALVKQHDFDVVISDQRMPVMTGVEFLREVKRVSPRSMRILLTGYSDLQAIVRSVNESEVFRFINKPWNISELPKVVEQAVTIARTQPVEITPEVSEETPILASGDSILVIDDNPGMGRAVEEIVGSAVNVQYAANLAEAVGVLNSQSVSVIVSETKVGSIDATRLVRLMKSRHPEIVTVMLTAESDADTVTTLINQGQIYRFVPKPIRPGYLKLVINSALLKHRTLSQDPALASRHAVDKTTEGAMESLMTDVKQVAAKNPTKAAAAAASGGLLGSFAAGFKRLFGG